MTTPRPPSSSQASGLARVGSTCSTPCLHSGAGGAGPASAASISGSRTKSIWVKMLAAKRSLLSRPARQRFRSTYATKISKFLLRGLRLLLRLPAFMPCRTCSQSRICLPIGSPTSAWSVRRRISRSSLSYPSLFVFGRPAITRGAPCEEPCGRLANSLVPAPKWRSL